MSDVLLHSRVSSHSQEGLYLCVCYTYMWVYAGTCASAGYSGVTQFLFTLFFGARSLLNLELINVTGLAFQRASRILLSLLHSGFSVVTVI